MIGKIILFIVFASSLVILFIISKRNQNLAVEERIIVCGTVTRIGDLSRGGYIIHYEYYMNGKLYQATGSCNSKSQQKIESGNRKFFVAVSLNDNNDSYFLENSEDYRKFNVSVSDTMNLNCD